MTKAEQHNAFAFLEGKIDSMFRQQNVAGLKILVASLADAAKTPEGAFLEQLARHTERSLRNLQREQFLARLGIGL